MASEEFVYVQKKSMAVCKCVSEGKATSYLCFMFVAVCI